MQIIDHTIIATGAAGKLSDAANPNIPVGMIATLHARLVDAAGEAAPPSGLGNVASWRFVLAEDWDPDTVPCYLSTDVAYDPATATWTIPLTATRTEQALYALGTRGSIDIGCEIAGIPENGEWDKPVYVLQWTAKLLNRRDGDGVSTDPTTGERVANILRSGNRVNEIRMTNTGTVVFRMGAEEIEADAETVAAVLASGVTAEMVEQMTQQASKIVSPNKQNVVDVANDGKARHYTPNVGWGAATLHLASGYGCLYGETGYQTAEPRNLVFRTEPTAISGYGKVWILSTLDIKPDTYDYSGQYRYHLGNEAGWHFWCSAGDSAPTELRYFDGARYTVTGWDSAAPALELSRGDAAGGAPTLSRPVEDSTEYHELAHKDDLLPAIWSEDGLRKVYISSTTGRPVVWYYNESSRTVGSTSTLSWGSTTGAILVEMLDDHTWAEYAEGVSSSFGIRATIYPDATAVLNNGTPYPVVVTGTATLQVSQNNLAQYSLSSSSWRLNGLTMLMDASGVYSIQIKDKVGATTLVETTYTSTGRTAAATRTQVYADPTVVPIAFSSEVPAIDATLAVSGKAADAKATGDALAFKAAATHSHTLSDISDAGDAAGKDVGTTAGTVAAGDHTHSEYASAADVTAIQNVIPSDASAENKLVTQSNVPQPQLRYALVEPALTPSGTTVSATLQDRAVNAVTLASTVTAATFTFPAPVAGFARDFFLRLVIEGSTVPTISFLESGGGSLEDAFDADDDAWAEIEPGVNVLMFTETLQEAAS